MHIFDYEWKCFFLFSSILMKQKKRKKDRIQSRIDLNPNNVSIDLDTMNNNTI